MKKTITTIYSLTANSKKKLIAFAVLSVAFSSIMLLSNTTGPAKQRNVVTGAPYDNNQTCAKSGCHGGGNFGGSITTELIDATGIANTSYVPGKSYTFRITLNKTTGTPQYGFQTSAATVSGSTNINNWGALTTDMHNQAVSGRNYVEQSKRLVSKIMSIPWTAPVAGTGSIIFYTAGNLVNFDGGTTGDQPVNTSLTITQGVAPVAAANTITDAKPAIPNKNNYSLKLYNQEGSMYVMFHNSLKQQKVQLIYTDIQGNVLLNGTTVANEGDNIWPVKGSKIKGLVVVNVITADGVKTSLKVIANQ